MRAFRIRFRAFHTAGPLSLVSAALFGSTAGSLSSLLSPLSFGSVGFHTSPESHWESQGPVQLADASPLHMDGDWHDGNLNVSRPTLIATCMTHLGEKVGREKREERESG